MAEIRGIGRGRASRPRRCWSWTPWSARRRCAVAEAFRDAVPITGLILTKIDGDARGGAALSISAVTGVPVKFMGTGEKTDALEVFHPDRLAGRILGMGDVLTLVERAQENIDEKQAEQLAEKLRKNSFTLEDFLDADAAAQEDGPAGRPDGDDPRASAAWPRMPRRRSIGASCKRVEAIIQSMTPAERRDPNILNASRRRRIARGSGTTLQEVNRLIKQFAEMQKLMKQLSSSGGRRGLAGVLPFGR